MPPLPSSFPSIYLLLVSLLALFTPTHASTSTSTSTLQTQIFYQPLSSTSSPSPLAEISYDPSTLKSKIISFTPPQSQAQSNIPNQDNALVKIGLFTGSSSTGQTGIGNWVGSLASLSALQNGADGSKSKSTLKLTLFLDGQDRVFDVSLSAGSKSEVSSGSGDGNGGVEVEFVKGETSPLPQLNRPVVKTQGQGPGEEAEEKTLLQRYWWVIPILFVLTIGGGGGGQ